MRIPKNSIKEGKYTAGGEFIVESTNVNYVGYYYKLNGALYAGKSYDVKAPKLVPVINRNQLLTKGLSTAVYSVVSGITSQMLRQPLINSIPSVPLPNNPTSSLKFYCKKINSNIIKEIDETTYNSLQSQPIYQSTFIGTYNKKTQTVDQAEQQVPGVKAFLAV